VQQVPTGLVRGVLAREPSTALRARHQLHATWLGVGG
jgi:hypothetical protein